MLRRRVPPNELSTARVGRAANVTKDDARLGSRGLLRCVGTGPPVQVRLTRSGRSSCRLRSLLSNTNATRACTPDVANGTRAQGHRDTEAQGHSRTKTCRGTGAHRRRQRDSGTSGTRGTGAQRGCLGVQRQPAACLETWRTRFVYGHGPRRGACGGAGSNAWAQSSGRTPMPHAHNKARTESHKTSRARAWTDGHGRAWKGAEGPRRALAGHEHVDAPPRRRRGCLGRARQRERGRCSWSCSCRTYTQRGRRR